MTIKKLFLLTGIAAVVLCSSCNNNESYTDKLNSERYATNAYLSQFKIINKIPDDTVFQTGANAPFYKLDADGDVYMQVLRAGSKATKPNTSQTVYFRYKRYDLTNWYTSGTWESEGNDSEMSLASSYFLFNDMSLPVSSQWGYGLQMPLMFLGIDSEVNLVVKSQYGITDEISYVMPFLYHVRYFKSQI